MRPRVRVNLALQGGGAHGAFTWGVLDRLLEEDWIEVAGISGASAGAMNGAALKAGMLSGGRAGARASLDQLWHDIGKAGDFRLQSWFSAAFPFAGVMSDMMQEAFPVSASGVAAQLYSPYAWGSLWKNPLEAIVKRLDFTNVCAQDGPALFISATNVRTGRIRVFSGDEIGPEVLLASTCLPTVFQAVEMEDPATGRQEAFWDGGYAGNPALFPLYGAELPNDIIIISINPLIRDEVPQTPLDIQNRINEISFNATLLGELRAVSFVKRLIAAGRMPVGTMKDANIHMISDDVLMNSLSASSKTTPTPQLVQHLHAAGRVAAELFVQDHGDDLGQRSSLGLRGLFG